MRKGFSFYSESGYFAYRGQPCKTHGAAVIRARAGETYSKPGGCAYSDEYDRDLMAWTVPIQAFEQDFRRWDKDRGWTKGSIRNGSCLLCAAAQFEKDGKAYQAEILQDFTRSFIEGESAWAAGRECTCCEEGCDPCAEADFASDDEWCHACMSPIDDCLCGD